ncbi:DUF3151 domain-containing protein [Cryptosporangium sp. NPDC048952]|uniref:DUF3151 domain-containing protein n=1 Tax=Cryptosporangium sp. NPDC048952 TaxID=3363961 RepID=UPI003713D537
MSLPRDLLPQPPATLLPEDPEELEAVREASTGEQDPAAVAARYPTSSGAWAVLADQAFAKGDAVASYAYARTGYHRGLDALRRNGWKGHGPVPFSHEGNQGFLRALNALARAALEIGESDESARCAQFLRDSDPSAADRM